MHSMQQTNEIFILTNLKDFHTGKKSNLLKRQLIQGDPKQKGIFQTWPKNEFLGVNWEFLLINN